MRRSILTAVLAACSFLVTDGVQGAPRTARQHPQQPITDLPAAAFAERIKLGDAQLVDVRTAREYRAGHLAGARNLDWTAPDYETLFATLESDKPVLVYCAMGGRSEQAKEYLVGRGFTVLQLTDGIKAWEQAGLPVVKDPAP